jgi:hypothetical protein
VLDLAAISLSVASYIAAAAKFLTPHSSHPLKTQYLLASFRNNLLPLNLPGQMNSHFWRRPSLTFSPHLKPVQLRHAR